MGIITVNMYRIEGDTQMSYVPTCEKINTVAVYDT